MKVAVASFYKLEVLRSFIHIAFLKKKKKKVKE